MSERIRELIARDIGIKVDMVTNDAKLVDDLGADSLDIAVLTVDFEVEFDIEIPDEKALGWNTVGDVISYIKDEA